MGKFFSNPHQYAKFQLVSTHKEVTEIMKALKTGKNVRSPYGNSFPLIPSVESLIFLQYLHIYGRVNRRPTFDPLIL